MRNLRDLQSTNQWLVAHASTRDPAVGCSEPVGPDEKVDTSLAGLPATRFVRKDPTGKTYNIIDVIALRGTICYTLQLTTGTAIPVEQAVATVQAVQSTYRLNA
jgi:hypothetical protein